jgi:hypothetical protein
MIFTMNFHLASHMKTLKPNLTRLQAGDSGWPQSCHRCLGKSGLARLATATDSIWRKDDETKMEDEL